MPKQVEISLSPEALYDEAAQRFSLARALGVRPEDLRSFRLLRKSLDARKRPPRFNLRYEVFFSEEEQPQAVESPLRLRDVLQAEPVVVVGAGPAGLFAALRLIELGLKPIILERGKAVRDRRRDIANLTKQGIVNPESNYCFGEGGAGTFSDGKLYTRSTKRGSVERILKILFAHGASSEILIDAHPHVGTNRLPAVVQNLRESILSAGGEIHFSSHLSGFEYDSQGMKAARLSGGLRIPTRALLLATGHSARDIFYLLRSLNLKLESKPFALGVRVEHPQSLIDKIQFGQSPRNENLPAASYSLVTQCQGRGVFSFCMCPGGIICPAATAEGELVVNGWSPSKRNSYFANSGIVVEVKEEDLLPFKNAGELRGLEFQQSLERKAFIQGGGKQVAPATRLSDFVQGRRSGSLPLCSYLPGVTPGDMQEIFPSSIYQRLIQGFKNFSSNMPSYLSNEALVLAVESRTSSPLRIPRDKQSLMHPELSGLFPLAEGAGYAGGIMSAAMDGERGAEAAARYLAL